MIHDCLALRRGNIISKRVGREMEKTRISSDNKRFMWKIEWGLCRNFEKERMPKWLRAVYCSCPQKLLTYTLIICLCVSVSATYIQSELLDGILFLWKNSTQSWRISFKVIFLTKLKVFSIGQGSFYIFLERTKRFNNFDNIPFQLFNICIWMLTRVLLKAIAENTCFCTYVTIPKVSCLKRLRFVSLYYWNRSVMFHTCFLFQHYTEFLLFVDDFKVYKIVTFKSDILNVQSDLNRLDDWCMEFIIDKCHIVCFSMNRNSSNFFYTLVRQNTDCPKSCFRFIRKCRR